MSKKYCINCGSLVPIQAKFCPQCGAPQHGPEAGVFRASAPVIAMNAAAVAIAESANIQEKSDKKYNQFDNIPKKRLGKNAMWAFFFDYIVKTSILPLLFLVGSVFEPVIATGAFFAYFTIMYASALLVYENFNYSTDDVGFQKSFGVVHKKQVTIPYQQIQNVNISRTLVDRVFGLSHVSIETAGNSAGTKTNVTSTAASASEGYLPGLTLDEAKYLHDLLLTRAREG